MSDTFGDNPATPQEPQPSHASSLAVSEDIAEGSKSANSKKMVPMRRGVLAGCAVVLFLIACYSLAGLYLVPRIIAQKLPASFSADSGLLLTVRQVQFNPFSFRLSVADLQIVDVKTEEGRKEIAHIDSLEAKISPIAALRSEYICESLLIDGFFVEILRDKDGKYTLGQLFAQNTQQKTPDLMNLAELPVRFSLNNITAHQGRTVFRDIPGETTHLAENIEFALPSFSNIQYQSVAKVQPKFSAVINGSAVELVGKAEETDRANAAKGTKTELSCTLRDLDLAKHLKYIPIQLPLSIVEGKADGVLQLSFFQAGGQARFEIDFSLKTIGLVMESSGGRIRFSMPTALIDGSIHPLTGDTVFKNIMTHDYAIVSQDPPLKLASLVAVNAGDSKNSGKSRKFADVSIENLLFEGGTYNFVDGQAKKRTEWENVDIRVSQFVHRTETEKNGKDTGSYSIQAKQKMGKGVVRLDGNFTDGILLEGKVKLEKIICSQLFSWFGVQRLAESEGMSEFEGIFSLAEGANGSENASYRLSKGHLDIKDFSMVDTKSRMGLKAPELKITELASDGETTSFGNVIVHKSDLRLDAQGLPTLFSSLYRKENPLSIKSLDFSGAIVLHKQNAGGPALTLSDAKLIANDLDTAKKLDDKDNFTFSAAVGSDGQMQAKGFVTFQPLAVSLRTGFDALQASILRGWVSNTRLIESIHGKMDGRGLLSLPRFSFNGDVQIHDGGILLPGKKEHSIQWDSMDIQGIRHSFAGNQTSIAEILLKKPYISTQIQEKSPALRIQLANFFQDLLSSDKKSSSRFVASSSPVEIQKLSFEKASLEYTDTRIKPAWKVLFTDVSGSAADVYTVTGIQAGPVSVKGLVEGAPFTYTGKMALLDYTLAGESKFSVSNFPLAQLPKQISSKLDLDPDQGSLGCEVVDTWRDNNLDEKAKVLFRDVEALSTGGATSFALALLDNGQREYEYPLNSNRILDKPTQPLPVEAISAFQKVVARAASAPLSIASGNYSDLVGQEFVEFQPGKAVLTDNGKKAVARFAELLKKHPSLSLTLNGGVDTHADRDALKKELEKEELLRVEKENSRHLAGKHQGAGQQGGKPGKEGRAKNTQQGGVEQVDLHEPVGAGIAKPQPVTVDAAALKELAESRAKLLFATMKAQKDLYHGQIVLSPTVRVSREKNEPGNKVHISISRVENAGKEQQGH